MGLIYKADLPNGKSYIGKTTKTLEERIKTHKKDMNREVYKNNKFYNSVRKYGFDSISWEILALAENINDDDLNELETVFIKKYDTVKNGLNSTYGGTGGDTFSCLSEERLNSFKKKTSKRMSGEKNPMYGKLGRITGERNPMKDPAVVERIASIHRGRKRSLETCRRISEAKRLKKKRK